MTEVSQYPGYIYIHMKMGGALRRSGYIRTYWAVQHTLSLVATLLDMAL